MFEPKNKYFIEYLKPSQNLPKPTLLLHAKNTFIYCWKQHGKQYFESIPGNWRSRQVFHYTNQIQPTSQKTVSVFSDLGTNPLSDNT